MNEEEDLEEDIPKRKNRPRGRVSGEFIGMERKEAKLCFLVYISYVYYVCKVFIHEYLVGIIL